MCHRAAGANVPSPCPAPPDPWQLVALVSNVIAPLRHPVGEPCAHIRVHDVRHSWATAALGAGVPLKVVSERLGHASVSITADTYRHVTEGLDRQAADKVAGLIIGVSKP